MDAGELRALTMVKRSRTQGKGRANPSRPAPATPPIGSFDLVLRIINGEFDGPELVAIYQAAYLRLLEVSPPLLADAQHALRGAQDEIRRLIAPE
jgi:hypothetical protein